MTNWEYANILLHRPTVKSRLRFLFTAREMTPVFTAREHG